MIEIDVPTIDPIQHEPKMFWGLSLRQIVLVVPSLIVGIGLFVIITRNGGNMAVIALITVLAPCILFGWVKPYNMKFEDYLRLLWKNNVINSPKRIYKTDEADGTRQQTKNMFQGNDKKLKEELSGKKENKLGKKER